MHKGNPESVVRLHSDFVPLPDWLLAAFAGDVAGYIEKSGKQAGGSSVEDGWRANKRGYEWGDVITTDLG